MVVRQRKRKFKYFGTRSWGVGNIKNARGAGDRGGVGRGGRKHKYTHTVVYEPGRIHTRGFKQWRKVDLREIDLNGVSKNAVASGEAKPTLTLRGYKVLGDGELTKPAVVKATNFSKKAMEKIKASGGEAIKL